MKETHASKIVAANTTLMTEGNLDAVAEFFTSNYAVHLAERLLLAQKH